MLPPPLVTRPRPAFGGYVLLTFAIALAGCGRKPFTYSIEPSLTPTEATLPGLDGGPARTVGAARGADGTVVRYVVNELILHPTSHSQVQALVAKYAGAVLRDGTPVMVPDTVRMRDSVLTRTVPDTGAPLLIRIDPSHSKLDDFQARMRDAGVKGAFTFSSDDAARLMAVVARERDLKISLNLVSDDDEILEHPDGAGGNLDAETWWWMTEDDDASTPAEDGLSVGVIHAWRYLQYQGVPPAFSGTWRPAWVAVLDRGFDLNPVTGVPNNGNTDFFYLGAMPVQLDMVNHAGRVGGMSNNTSLPWHGQGVFGVCCAYPRNLFGGAGTGGSVVRLILVRHDGSAYSKIDGIRSAVINGAQVINVSSHIPCGWYCGTPFYDIEGDMLAAVRLGAAWGTIVVASAGNEGANISGDAMYPCTLSHVICVGAIDQNRNNLYNYGSPVDIWAPTNVFTTVTPPNVGKTGTSAICCFGGTSASTPFVAGIVGLMKALNPDLTPAQVVQTLQATANPSPDAKVAHGYVDAYRAVAETRHNIPPTVQVLRPLPNALVSWKIGDIEVGVTDPEPGAGLPLFADQTNAVFSSSVDGAYCSTNHLTWNAGGWGYRCPVPPTLGAHAVTIAVTDPFGATGTATVNLTVINRPPTVSIVEPLAAGSYIDHQPIHFEASVADPDELIEPASISWTSSQDGPLGTGYSLTKNLTQGTHTVAVVVTDAKGLSATATVSIDVGSGAGLPAVTILTPAENEFLSTGQTVTLSGTATDPEDGALAGASLRWSSSRDGLLGTGQTLSLVLSGPTVACNPETVAHIITLQATDNDGNVVAVSRPVTVGVIC